MFYKGHTMNKTIFCILSIALMHGNSSVTMTPPKGVAAHAEKVKVLETVAERYRVFLDQFGKKETGDLLPQMKSLFDPNCLKIVNDKTVSTTIEGLHKQISDGKKDIGTWEVKRANPYVASPEENMVVAHFRIPTEKLGTIVVMKYLFCNTQGLIKVIDEVFNTATK